MPIFEGDAALHLKKYRKFFVPYLTTGGHKRIPSREGGVEIVVEELASRMSQLGHDVTCYNRKGKHVMDKSIEKNHLSEYKGVHLKSVLTIDKKGLSAMSSSFFASIQAAFSNG